MDATELKQVQQYLRDTFRLDTIEVRRRTTKSDSAEVYIGDEFVGVLFKDVDEGEVSYQFQMAILDIDLPEIGG